MPAQPRVAIIGAGIGGLSAAILLAARGVRVEVYERAPAPGGKMREVNVAGADIDAGPTVFTMRWVFEELFAAAGADLESELGLTKAEIIARHAWDDRGYLDLYADLERSAEAIEAFCGGGEGERFLAFSEGARKVYETLKEPFIRSAKTNPLGLTARIGRAGLGGMFHIKPYSTLWQALTAQFQDPRLRQLFGRYATYAGSSPYLSPATLMLIAYVEQEGVWLVHGGMHQLAVTMARIARGLGAQIHCGSEVAEIVAKGGRVQAIRLAEHDATPVAADAVVVNADASALGSGLFGAHVRKATAATRRRDRSLSALTWKLHATTSGFPLVRHSVFFSSDYLDEFERIFAQRQLPQEPTVYICAQDRDADLHAAAPHGPAPTGPERLLLLVNAPADGDQGTISASAIEVCRDRTMRLLERCGLAIDYREDAAEFTGPNGFDRLFPATGGALYGRASHGWQASFSRPGARAKVKGLYLAGGSTHPGAGVPMAALSGRQAASAVLTDLAGL